MSTNPYAEVPLDAQPVEATLVDSPKKKSWLPTFFGILTMGLTAITFSPEDLSDPAIYGEAYVQGELMGQLIGTMFVYGIFGWCLGYVLKRVLGR